MSTVADQVEDNSTLSDKEGYRTNPTILPPEPGVWPPNYTAIYAWRQQQLLAMADEPALAVGAFEWYRTRPVEFICHWCDTYDPRNVGVEGKLDTMPFMLFRRQIELVEFIQACLGGQAPGLVEKSRTMGATWVCVAITVWMWLYHPRTAIGWGSRVEKLVDKLGDPDSIFEKIRMLIRSLPPFFLPAGFDHQRHMTYMRVINPVNGATITGEIGDDIGRGGRKRIYFVDEAAHLEHPEMVDASLSGNTKVRIDVSSVTGLGTVFHRKREAGIDWTPGAKTVRTRANIFVMDWRDHPDMTQQWYDELREYWESQGSLHIFAQEIERNYSASVVGRIIPADWVAAAIDADKVLGIDDSGMWGAALDVADGGGDVNALCTRKGIVVKSCDEWGARDTGVTTRKAIDACRGKGDIDLQYDAASVGAGVKAESNRLFEEHLIPSEIHLIPWFGGGEVLDKDKNVVPGDKQSPLNGDFYGNLKAQAWWQLRLRFERTWRAVQAQKGIGPAFTWKAEDLIVLPSTLPLLRKIQKELSQATATQNARLKLIVDKMPEGMRSPNLADAIVMAFWPANQHRRLIVPNKLLDRMRAGGQPAYF